MIEPWSLDPASLASVKVFRARLEQAGIDVSELDEFEIACPEGIAKLLAHVNGLEVDRSC
jgi:hypothetical protein